MTRTDDDKDKEYTGKFFDILRSFRFYIAILALIIILSSKCS